MILIGEPCIFNLCDLCQTGSSYIRQESVHFISMNKQALYFFYDNLLSGQFQLKLFCCGKGRQNFASNVTLYPCECSHQNYLATNSKCLCKPTSESISMAQLTFFLRHFSFQLFRISCMPYEKSLTERLFYFPKQSCKEFCI